MRKIDTKAYNKRLHSEILELSKMVRSINPEHINLFDAKLIRTANNYIKLISEANWSSNSNVNGIELHKIKDMSGEIKIKDRTYRLVRGFAKFVAGGKTGLRSVKIPINVPDTYDGRNSFVITNYLNPLLPTGAVQNCIKKEGGQYNVFKQASEVTVDIKIHLEKYDLVVFDVFILVWK